MEALAVLFLALRFLAITHFLLRCVLASVFPNHSHALHFLVILSSIGAAAAATLVRAHLPGGKAFAVELETASFFAHTSSFLLLLRRLKTLVGSGNNILGLLVVLALLVLLN